MTRTIRSIIATATVVATVCVAQPTSVHAAPSASRATQAGAAAVYFLPTERFLELKRRHAGPYNWTDDGCSVPAVLKVSLPVLRYASSTFAGQCEQHDFAYRNFGGSMHLDSSEARRRSVDQFFLVQMQRRCHRFDIRRAHHVTRCLAYARVFYLAVRTFGRL
jgi:hypothetical protein